MAKLFEMRYLFTLATLFISTLLSGQTIQEIQGMMEDSPYVGEIVTTSGIVTAVEPDGFFIQDGEGAWSGIYIYDSSEPAIGDDVTLTGEVEEFYNLTEIKNLTSFTINSSGNTLPAFSLLTTGEVAQEAYEGVLVRVESAICDDPDLGFGEFGVNDGSGQCRVDDLFYLFTATEGVLYNVQGPCSYTFGDYKIMPRDENDVEIAEPLYFTELPEEFEMTANSMEIRWETNVEANSVIEYGLTLDYEMGFVVDETQVTEHALSLTELEPATSYYVRVSSENGEDITPGYEFIVSTTSSMDGEIKLWFNHSVDTSVSTGTDAVSTEAISDTIIEYMLSAQHTLDIAMYDLLQTNPALITTINELYNAGVEIRFISDLETENLALNNLDPGIEVLKGNNDGIMHDKFLIGDAEYPELAWVMTGSMNWTSANLGWDYNNVMWIKDQALARTYKREFEEMWGGSDLVPNEDISVFGPDKTNNTAHKFIINGIPVESYFSPTDGTTAQIRERMDEAQQSMALGMMVFTENSLGQGVLNAHNAGVDVKGIIDYVEFNGSEFDMLVDNGVNVVDYQNEDGTQWPDGPVLHHKYMIVDYLEGAANPVLVNGSHNWSASAESINDENTLIIYDATLVNQFYQEWLERWNEQNEPVVSVSELQSEDYLFYPNPFQDVVRFETTSNGTLQVFDAQGRLVFIETTTTGVQELSMGHLPAGSYTLIWEGETRFEQLLIKR